MIDEAKKINVYRFCTHCQHEWDALVTYEELQDMVHSKPVGECPKCGLSV